MSRCRHVMRCGTVVVALTVGVTGCGSGQATISAGASSQLFQQVQAVRSAAASGNRLEAQAQLAQLQAEVASLRAQHQIATQRADQILAAASAVNTELAKLPSQAPMPTVETTQPPDTQAPQPAGPPGKKKHGNN